MRAEMHNTVLRRSTRLLFSTPDSREAVLDYFTSHPPQSELELHRQFGGILRLSYQKTSSPSEILGSLQLPHCDSTQLLRMTHARASMVRHGNYSRRRKCKRQFAPVSTAAPFRDTNSSPSIPSANSGSAGFANYLPQEPWRGILVSWD